MQKYELLSEVELHTPGQQQHRRQGSAGGAARNAADGSAQAGGAGRSSPGPATDAAAAGGDRAESRLYPAALGAHQSPWRLQHGAFAGSMMSEEQLLGLRQRRRGQGGGAPAGGPAEDGGEAVDGAPAGSHSGRAFPVISRLVELTPWAGKSGVEDFYRRQNEAIEAYAEMEALADGTARHKEGPEPYVQLAMWLSLTSNIVLLGAKIVAAMDSGSLSIFTSVLDSLLDIVSGVILFITARSMASVDKYVYPVGKTRMEPLGILVFACIMGTISFQVLLEGFAQLVGQEHTHHMEHMGTIIAIMLVVIAVKAGLYLFCRGFSNEAVCAYAQDHRNDVITNIFGLATALMGDRLAFWLDPAGAILLAAMIVRNWGTTALENIQALVGLSAPPELLQKLTWLSWNHHPAIIQIDTVRAYTFGKAYIAEVDVVLPRTMPLVESHDIGESLQIKLEALPEIERAFVHLDYETNHKPEH